MAKISITIEDGKKGTEMTVVYHRLENPEGSPATLLANVFVTEARCVITRGWIDVKMLTGEEN